MGTYVKCFFMVKENSYCILYTPLPPHDDIKFCGLQGILKTFFALEPLLKLASSVVEEVIFQNVKKKVKKIFPRRCNRRRRKRGLKTGNFFKIDIFHI